MQHLSRKAVEQDDFLLNRIDAGWDSPLVVRLVVRGTNRDDTLVGTAANETFKPRTGMDRVTGGGGVDILLIDYSREAISVGTIRQNIEFDSNGYLYGDMSAGNSKCEFSDFSKVKARLSDGNEIISFSPMQDGGRVYIDAGLGYDTLNISLSNYINETIVIGTDDGSVSYETGVFTGFEIIDILGGFGNDTIFNISGTISGGGGDDYVSGAARNDRITGASGVDFLEGNGGADRFEFYTTFATSSPEYGIDTILDFSHAEGDFIDFGILDCDKTIRGYQEFDFIGDAAITDAGQLRSVQTGDGIYRVEGNTDDDADLEFILIVHADAPLVASDFGL